MKSSLKSSVGAVVVAAVASVLAPSTARATLLAYEPFSYAIGTHIGGLVGDAIAPSTGSFGFGNAAAGNGNYVTESGGSGNVQWSTTTGLTYTAGGQTLVTSNGAALLSQGNGSKVNLPLTTAIPGGGVSYFSCLIKLNSGSGSVNNADLEFFGSVNTDGTGATPGDHIGIRTTHAAMTGAANYWTFTQVGADLRDGNTHLFVAKYDQPAGTLSMYVDPIPGTEPGTATLIATGHQWTNQAIADVQLNGGNIWQDGTTIDEVRVGQTFADVTPVPEPASFGVLGITVGSLLLRRRKQA